MKRHSLHIGIDRYEDRSIQDLPFCTADAALLASFFRDVAGYESVSQLDNPTRDAILAAVAAEAGRLGSGDLLVLTYSGHGLPSENGGPLLVAADSRAERLRAGVDGVPLRRLAEAIRGAGAHLVVFLDACQSYDGGTRGGFSPTSSPGAGSRDRTLSVGDFTDPCLCVMSPEKTLEIPSLGHGLFTAALHRALLEAHGQGTPALLHVLEGTRTQMKSLCEAHGIACPSVSMESTGAVETCRLWSGRTKKRHALFVGVDEYADPTIQDLRYPSEDAAELASVFRRQLKFDRVEKLINPAHAAEVLDRVEAMTTGLGSDDLFLFFFAGHGFRVKENHVLVCAKDKYAELEDEYDGLPVGRLKKRMRGPWNQMLVLDACQNDIRTTRGGDTGVTARDLKLIHATVSGGGDSGCQIVVTSCSEGQRALEVSDLGHGLFTSAFLDSVTTFADARQRIDPEVLRADLGKRMGRLIDRYRLSGEQMPLFTMPPSAADIVLFDGAAPAPDAVAPVRSVVPVPALVVCPICGKKNEPKDTFRCKGCGRDNLCLRHQDEDTFLCRDCAAKAREAESVRPAESEGPAAEAESFYTKGEDYYSGRNGCRQDDAEAVKWYRKAAEQGHAEAQFNLGRMYDKGRGVPKDDAEAVKWLRKAAEQGNAKAQYYLGCMYGDGCGVPKDDAEAVKWFRKAVEQGNAYGLFALGCMYENGRGVPKDETEAARWYRKAAEQGDAYAQFNLGLMYANGRGVPKDDSEAVKWYRKAAEQGDADAQFNLSWYYHRGRGVPKDGAEAMKLRRKAAEQGHAEAQYELGVRYSHGLDGTKDEVEAASWFRKAAEQGHAKAQNALGHAYKYGEGVPKDKAEAMKWYRKAAEQGDASSQTQLGDMYRYDKQDDAEAVKWYRMAAEQGSEWASAALKSIGWT